MSHHSSNRSLADLMSVLKTGQGERSIGDMLTDRLKRSTAALAQTRAAAAVEPAGVTVSVEAMAEAVEAAACILSRQLNPDADPYEQTHEVTVDPISAKRTVRWKLYEPIARTVIEAALPRLQPDDRPGVDGRIEYTSLRDANIARQAAWCPDQVPDLSFRGNELGGECGEVQNVIKKLERERHGWRGSRDTVKHLAEELGDVVICADLVAITAGIDLDAAVRAKFNATSEKVGLPHRLAAALVPGAAAGGAPAGWKLVPVEPTTTIIQAIFEASRSALAGDDEWQNVWTKALSAAPPPPSAASDAGASAGEIEGLLDELCSAAISLDFNLKHSPGSGFERQARSRYEAARATLRQERDAAVPQGVDLLPCPFCGGAASFEEVDGAAQGSAWTVGCDDAGGVECIGFQPMTTFSRKSEAARAWNRRATAAIPAAPERTVSAMAEAIRRTQRGFSCRENDHGAELHFGSLDGFLFEDGLDECTAANLVLWLNRMLASDRLRIITTLRGSEDNVADTVTEPLTLNIMAKRVRTFYGDPDALKEAEDLISYAFTGLPPGPERDAALSAILARLQPDDRPGVDVEALRAAARAVLAEHDWHYPNFQLQERMRALRTALDGTNNGETSHGA